MSTRQARLRLRAAVLQSVRSFFAEHGYLEIETPVRVNPPALEAHIDAIPSGDAWLRTSPELHMKRLLAEGFERIFQVGPCFRAGERGRVHRPEYTMLEWYRAGAGYLEILEETTALVRRVAVDTLGGMEFTARGCTVDVGRPWDRVTVSDAFLHTAGWDPVAWWRIEPVYTSSMITHQLKPSVVLALSDSLYGRCPEAYTLSVLGHDFDFGEELAPDTSALADQAVSRLIDLLALMGVMPHLH